MKLAEKLDNITFNQIEKMKLTIGFDNSNVTGIKHRKYAPVKNCYDACISEAEQFETLCEIGLMKRNGYLSYYVTDLGKKFLKIVTGVEILEDDDEDEDEDEIIERAKDNE